MTQFETLLGVGAPASAASPTFTLQQHPAATNCPSSTSCLATVSATGAGNLLIAVAIAEVSNVSVTTFSSNGCASTWQHAAGVAQAAIGGAEIWYCLNSASGATSIGPSVWSGTGNLYTAVREFSKSSGTFALNSGGTPTASCNTTGGSTNPTACSLTVSSNNSVYVVAIAPTVSVSAISGGYTGTFPNGNGEAFIINQTTYTPPTWTGTGNYNASAAAVQVT